MEINEGSRARADMTASPKIVAVNFKRSNIGVYNRSEFN